MTRLLPALAVIAACWPTPAGEGARLPATASALRSAPGYGPELAVDRDENTLWLASLKPDSANNRVWFQLDLGSVKPIARLHWIAAQGTPYPASAPAEYRVLLSDDGARWKAAAASPPGAGVQTHSSVLLNADARYVRLETTKINDGTGWALGIKEIWVTGGRDASAVAEGFRPRCQARDGAIRLTWQTPTSVHPGTFRLYRVDEPGAKGDRPLATLRAGRNEYLDRVPNWTPRYYWLEAVDAGGRVLLTSEPAAAFARPPDTATAPIETFAFWYETYKPSTDPDASLKHLGDAAFVVGPGAGAAADLAANGKGVLPYVTFYQTSGWARTFPATADPQQVAKEIAPVAFYHKGLHFPGSPPGYAPSVFCRPDNVEYNAGSILYTACPNSARLRELVLAHVRSQLDGGVLGFFVDNGYEDDVAAGSVCESRAHQHYYGEQLTGADAFLGLVMEVTCEVKRRHPNGVVMINGGVPADASFYGLSLGDVCDGLLWESYLRSSYSTPKEHVYDWQDVYRSSVELEKGWTASPPRRMFVLSYPWDRAEAFFCYASAKLCALPWSACLGISDPNHLHFGGHFGTYPELVDLRLGRPVEPAQYGGARHGEVYSREYDRGLVVVNPTQSDQDAAVPFGKTRRYREVFTGQEGEGDTAAAKLPPESGRVYLWR
jgi:hypothetical protein